MPYIPDMKGLGFVGGMEENPNKNMSPFKCVVDSSHIIKLG
jgi:hypothetical protein